MVWRARGLGAAFLALSAAIIAALAGELALRLDRRAALRDSESYRSASVFTNSWEAHAAADSLWQKRWQKYKPNARLELTLGGERYEVQINSLGFRTREFSPSKPAGVFRILCVGASTTVAGRTNELTYPALLEGKLKERFPGRPLEVLNLGISGTTSEYWLDRPDKLFALEPDLVVDYRAVNDIFWRHLPRYAALHPGRGLLHRSLLLERLSPFAPASLDPFLDETNENFLQMNLECRQRGGRYLTATFAAPDYAVAPPGLRQHLDTNLDFWNRDLPLHRYPEYQALLERHNERLLLFGHLRGMEVVPVARQLRDPLLFVDICHLTPEGIEKLALAFLPAVGRVIESEGWRTTRPSTSPVRRVALKPS